MIVVDTNVIAHLVWPGEWTAKATHVRQRDPEWAAPILWRSELRNVLARYLRAGHMDLAVAQHTMNAAERVMRRGGSHHVPSDDVLRLATESGCTAYDCEFVALARRLGVPLVTSDKALLRAFSDTARPLAEFGSET